MGTFENVHTLFIFHFAGTSCIIHISFFYYEIICFELAVFFVKSLMVRYSVVSLPWKHKIYNILSFLNLAFFNQTLVI